MDGKQNLWMKVMRISEYTAEAAITAGIAGFALGMLATVAYSNMFLISVRKTEQQSRLIDAGIASKYTFTQAAELAVSKKTEELLKANRDLIKEIRRNVYMHEQPQ